MASGPDPDAGGAVGTVVGFARTLRAAGVDAGPDRVAEAVRALDVLDPADRDEVYWAGRLTLCASAHDLARYDAAFAAYFAGETPRRRARGVADRRPRPVAAAAGEPDAEDAGETAPAVVASASRTEVLRQRDFSALTAAERAQLAALLGRFRLPAETRASRRRQASPSGAIDRRRTVRELLRRGGEPARLRHHERGRRPRRVVLLVDVSGSMAPYADALLRFAHAAGRGAADTEVFTVGTRLTRVTREMSHRDPDTALAAVSAAVPDWSGGTRLGILLGEFLDRWGRRGMARGAVVVVVSDGWERGDVSVLAEQMARLSRLAHRIVWANPRKGQPGYAPLAAGMAAALPHCDDFVSGHSLAALEHLADVVRGGVRQWRPSSGG